VSGPVLCQALIALPLICLLDGTAMCYLHHLCSVEVAYSRQTPAGFSCDLVVAYLDAALAKAIHTSDKRFLTNQTRL
jgi:hypothetical protein